jgi:hypothetical protein
MQQKKGRISSPFAPVNNASSEFLSDVHAERPAFETSLGRYSAKPWRLDMSLLLEIGPAGL